MIVNPNLTGNPAFTGDSVTLSLNSGSYITPANVPVPFVAGPLLGSNVDITNLKAQGFDGLPPLTPNPDGNGMLNIYISVQSGGLTRDVTVGSNATRMAASSNPFSLTGFARHYGLTTSAFGLPTTINTATTELRFSIPGAGAPSPANWFNNALDIGSRVNHLGSFIFTVGSGAPVAL